mgnify:CR=1 FL=1
MKLGIFGAVLTLIGDMLIGCVQFPEGADLIDGYLGAALALPVWRPILGGLIGCLGICLEVPALFTIYPFIKSKMPRSGAFYKISIYAYLALGGGAVHLPCGVFMWIYHTVNDNAGQEVAYNIAVEYLLYFLLPAAAVFMVFFFGANIIQFIAFAKGNTPFPKWYCIFNLLIFMWVFNSVRLFGNYAITNGIGTSNKSLGAIVMFAALLVGSRKYVHDDNEV